MCVKGPSVVWRQGEGLGGSQQKAEVPWRARAPQPSATSSSFYPQQAEPPARLLRATGSAGRCVESSMTGDAGDCFSVMVCVLLLHAELTPPCGVHLEPSCSTSSAGAPLASALTKCVIMRVMGRASTRMAACNVINVYGAGGEKGDAI